MSKEQTIQIGNSLISIHGSDLLRHSAEVQFQWFLRQVEEQSDWARAFMDVVVRMVQTPSEGNEQKKTK
ncbi:hypothetical protein [Sulfoacidibacillus thermotolerans]|uniref:Uncharacterized protein n=1 Tax=Sulfoacidibacillus thermotolerans TaxID=1765684 RepID=A0A2U3D9X9_SULT2|nr:hypothetical protein [Sulfoacidibacillus thermotolerans]PWI58088.1 hypothetical protein BM613_05325 [Sulfoacidibacillus thermotolerans]